MKLMFDLILSRKILIKVLENNCNKYSELLKLHGYRNAANKFNKTYDKESFLRKYIEIIDNISFYNNSRIWWSSEVASKNRFTTSLHESLYNMISHDPF